MNREPDFSPPTDLSGSTRITIWTGIVTAFALPLLAIALNSTGGGPNFWLAAPAFLLPLLGIVLARQGRQVLGAFVLIGAVVLQIGTTPLVKSGAGVPNAIATVALIGSIGFLTLPRKYTGRVLLLALFSGMIIILTDLFASSARPAADPVRLHWILAIGASAAFGFLFAREYSTLDIRTKIVFGILATGGLSLAVFGYFALTRAGQTLETLSGRLETSVRLLAEEQLINSVFTEATRANDTFQDIMDDLSALSDYWVSLQSNRAILGEGDYWDASTRLVEFDDGKYGSSTAEPSAVFVPAHRPLTPGLIADLNTSAHLDFQAPAILARRPSLIAVYAIDANGVTRYFPNIDLAGLLPPSYDATKRPFYVISSPLFNPQRVPRWSIPHIDATGRGLVATVAAPVYVNDRFSGVVAADMALAEITAQIGALKIGQTGFAYMIDSSGLIISMPPTGFRLFDMQPDVVDSDDFFRQTVLGRGPDELQAITRRMVAGGSGLLIIPLDGVDTYISFAPITANGYSVALVVPVAELQGAILTARNETRLQIQSAVQLAAVIFLGLLLVAVAISVAIGQIIAAPIVRLTRTADQIVAGDLSAQANVVSQDEIGALAQAFNTMTSRLRGNLEGLEQRVLERTSDLELANEKIERRARQFESVARITGQISSAADVDTLLSQITTAISSEFGFYHVGIFLLDPGGEYAVLSAANSEGGQKMLARNHKLKVGEAGLVGNVTASGKPRVALDTEEDAVFFGNSELAQTRSEIALPLRAGTRIIGALDAQSTRPNAFDSEDIHILATLADHVSIAIQNARQHEETRKALAEADSLSRQFIKSGWHEFGSTSKLIGIRHTGARAKLMYKGKGESAPGNGFTWDSLRRKSRGAYMTIPVSLRGEVIGSVEVRAPANRQWDQDELDVVSAIIDRAALALENARLLDESQKRAAKEAKIGEVTSRIVASINLRNVLQTAVEELGRALPGSEVTLQLEATDGKSASPETRDGDGSNA